MVQKKALVFLDTNLFVMDLRYQRDIHFDSNRACIDHVCKYYQGITSVVNLLELCGILSFNLNPKQLTELYHFFPQRYDVQVAPYSDPLLALPPFSIQQVFDILVTRASFGDALIVALIKKYLPKLGFFVSWDADHFKNKVTASVLTPLEFLKLGKK